MYCSNCRNQIPDGSTVCGYCGAPVQGGYGQGSSSWGMNGGMNGQGGSGWGMNGGMNGQGGSGWGMNGGMNGQGGSGWGMNGQGSKGKGAYGQYASGIGNHNIFMALMYARDRGVLAEFILWCTTCVVFVLSIIAVAVGRQNVTWVFLMLFSCGMGVLMAFRLRMISLLYGVSCFNLITFIIHFYSFSAYSWDWETSYFALNTVLFIMLLLAAVTAVVFAAIQFFTRFQFGKVLMILVPVQSGVAVLLHIMMYVMPFSGLGSEYARESYHESFCHPRAYWLGTISFWMMLAVVAVFYVMFFMGIIDNRKKTIISVSAGPVGMGQPGLRGVQGIYAGQVIPLQGKLAIGSGNGSNIVIQDPYVSGRHCVIWFEQGSYQIYDSSTNGVFLSNGMKLQPGVTSPVPRGSVICLGSQAQQFQLM